jgi:tetratricopeptide (TPR) repeat protein
MGICAYRWDNYIDLKELKINMIEDKKNLEGQFSELAAAVGKNPRQFNDLVVIVNRLNKEYVKNGEYKASIEKAKLAIDLGMKFEHPDYLTICKLYRMIALANRMQGDFQKAVRYLERELILAKEIQHLEEIGLTYATLGETVFMIGSINAKEYFAKADQIENEMREKKYHEDKETIEPWLKLSRAIGGYYLQKGCIKDAMAYFQRIDEHIDSFMDNEVKVHLLYSLGDYYLDAKDYNKASKRFEDCLSLSEKSGYGRGKVMAKIGLGKVFTYTGEDNKAKKYVVELEELISKPDVDQFAKTEVSYALGIIKRENGFYSQAVELLNNVIENYSKDTLEIGEARARREKARALAKMKNITEAKKEYCLAKRMFKDSLAMGWYQQLAREIETLA